MQTNKLRRLATMLLAVILLLSGCGENVSFVLPADSADDTVLVAKDPTTESTEATAHPHSYIQTVTDATCTDPGYTTHTCDCGHSFTDSETAALGHSYIVSTVSPTEAEQGYDLYQCSRCADSYRDNYTDPRPRVSADHVHQHSQTVTKPTCSEKGYTKHVCTCGDSYITSYTDPLGHDYAMTTVAPTTSSQGYDLYRCSRCGYSYKCNYTDRLPSESNPVEHKHNHSKATVKPTCTERGYDQYTCSCGDSYRSNYTDPLGHDYKVSVVLPTVQEEGYNLHKCTRCGYSYKDNYVDKLPAHTEPPETEPPEPPQYDHPVYDISDHTVGSLEYEILAEINARRTAEGLGELKMDKKLCALSAIRAYECTISFSHTRPNGSSCFSLLKEYSYKGGSIAGENLLYASSSYTAAQLVNVWMDSSSHKNNILSASFTKAGIGIFYSGGRIYVANFFAG